MIHEKCTSRRHHWNGYRKKAVENAVWEKLNRTGCSLLEQAAAEKAVEADAASAASRKEER